MSSADHETDSDELDPDEPRTPMWLPLLGGGLFLLALLLFLATRSDEEPVAEDNADTTAQQAPAEPQPEPPPAARARNAQAPDDEGTAPQPGRPRVLRGPSPTDDAAAATGQRPAQQRRAVQRAAEPRPAPGHEDHGH